MTFPQQLAGFERDLDAELDGRSVFRMDPVQAIQDAAGAVSVCYQEVYSGRLEAYGLAHRLELGFAVILPRLIATDPRPTAKTEIDSVALVEDLVFSSHYYMIREYL